MGGEVLTFTYPAQTLGYDALNRLVSVNAPSAVSYLYDGDDQRVKEAYSTTARYYVGPHMELQVSGSTKIYRTYYRLGDKLLGMRVDGTNIPAAEDGMWYFKIDHL
jgi:YD repeat-containing protein